jgi:outer membrane protein TolC
MDQVTQVITAYRALILSSNNFQNQRRQLADAKTIYTNNEKRIAAGQLEPAGNIQQAYQVESISLMVEQAANEFKTAAQELLQSIGLDPDMKLAVPDDVDVGKIDVPKLDVAIATALKHNPQYLAMTTAVTADERAYVVAKNQQLWQLDFTANAQTGTMTNVDANNRGIRGIYNGQNTTESAGVTLRIPLHDLERRSQLISAKIKLEKDRLNVLAAKRALMTAIKNIVSTISSQAKQYELAKRQLSLAEKSYELEKKKQHAGISSALDVNNTQNQLIQAQSRLISSKISYLNQLSALQRIVGTTLDAWKIKLRTGE